MKQCYKKRLIITILSFISYGAVNAENLNLYASGNYTNIVELVVAGIVAAALIIAVLVLFLGRWAGKLESKKIKDIRLEAEKEKVEVISLAETIRKQEFKTTHIIQDIDKHIEGFSIKRKVVDGHVESIVESSERIKAREEALIQTTNSLNVRMNKIQTYWDTQLKNTASTISDVQTNIDKTLKLIDQDLSAMQQQKQLSQDLLQDFLSKHRLQSEIINENSNISVEVSKNLEETLQGSTQLVDLLKQHKVKAEKSLSSFTEELTNFEEQAYEQFDSSFQVADLARQELTANVDESRVYIENMRRHEEQSRQINTQTRKNLEALDYSKIIKISNTLDSTQDLFTDIRDRVENTKKLLDELKDIEVEVRGEKNSIDDSILLNAGSMENDEIDTNANVYKMASGDNTPLSFFSKIKDKE